MNRTLLKSKHSCEFSAAKKIYFLFMALFCCLSGYSANCVSATKVSANYTTQQVTFKLTWTGCNGTTHLNKVWCFVDFQTVDAAGNKGAWQRATISGTPVVVNGTYAAGNTTGFYVTGVNGQSATVTVKLGNAAGRFNWCAVATDYPPQMVINSATDVKLKGTSSFTIKYTDNTTDVVSTATYSLRTGKTLASISDATTAPGNIQCLTRDKVPVNGYCCSGQTIVNGYCRDLVADDAYHCTASNIEVSRTLVATCPSGWTHPTQAQSIACCGISTQVGFKYATGLNEIAIWWLNGYTTVSTTWAIPQGVIYWSDSVYGVVQCPFYGTSNYRRDWTLNICIR